MLGALANFLIGIMFKWQSNCIDTTVPHRWRMRRRQFGIGKKEKK